MAERSTIEIARMLRRHGCAVIAALAALLASVPIAGAAVVPRASSDQWALKTIGTKDVWKRAQGAGVTVAIVDTGADMSLADLAPNLWTNPGEIPGNGIDDDGDGLVDDVHGYDFVDNDGDPSDQNGHGTHVAGIVGAACHTVCGVAPKAKLMIVRVLDASANGNTQTVAAGVRYAVDHGAKIINLSLVGSTPDPALQAAIDYAGSRGVLVVAAAGNDGGDVDTTPVYPASAASPNLISVAATNLDGGLAQQSNFGAHSVTLAAPGADIVSDAMGGGREYRTGTSMAAGVVSGSFAALSSAKPGASWQALRQSLVSTTRKGVPVETGRIRLDKALVKLAGKPKTKKHKHHRHSHKIKSTGSTKNHKR